jgi:hypothetical protein
MGTSGICMAVDERYLLRVSRVCMSGGRSCKSDSEGRGRRAAQLWCLELLMRLFEALQTPADLACPTFAGSSMTSRGSAEVALDCISSVKGESCE